MWDKGAAVVSLACSAAGAWLVTPVLGWAPLIFLAAFTGVASMDSP